MDVRRHRGGGHYTIRFLSEVPMTEAPPRPEPATGAC